MIGEKNWVFCDGYLPPAGDNPNFDGHEAIMVTNLNDEKAKFTLNLIFEDRDPIEGIEYELDAKRTMCIRMDKIVTKDGFKLGEAQQYTAWIKSEIPVCACFGRLDIRQTNMSYYSVEGYSF